MRNKYIDKGISIYKEKIKPAVDTLFSKTAVFRTGKRKIVYHPIKLAAVVIAAVLAIALLGAFVSMLSGSKTTDVYVEYGDIYKAKTIGSNVMIYNNKGAKAIDRKGKIDWQISQSLSEPLVECDGKYVLFADLAGNHFAASYKNGKLINEYKLGNDIISAKITSKGYAVFATDTDGYKGKVTLFNKKGREIYAWNSGSGYVADVDISDNGRYLAVAQINTDGDAVSTKMQFIDTSRGEVIATAERNDEAAVEVKFTSSNQLLLVTDNHITEYSKNGKEGFSISLEGKEASYYSLDSDKMIAVSVMDNRGNSVLEMYSMSGKLKGAYTATGEIRTLAVCDSNAVVAEQKGIVRVNSRGKVKKVISAENDVKSIGYYSNGKRILAVGASVAENIAVK